MIDTFGSRSEEAGNIFRGSCISYTIVADCPSRRGGYKFIATRSIESVSLGRTLT
jgi:hypothetical protein